MKKLIARTPAIAASLLAAVALGACSSGGETVETPTQTQATSPPVPSTTVAVTLREFAVGATPTTVPAGPTTFQVANAGPADVHEFVVIETDLDPTALPADDDGVVLEDAEGLRVIGEIENIQVGGAESLSIDLEAGSYALICNILQEEPDGTLEAHYAEGMRAGFTVT